MDCKPFEAVLKRLFDAQGGKRFSDGGIAGVFQGGKVLTCWGRAAIGLDVQRQEAEWTSPMDAAVSR